MIIVTTIMVEKAGFDGFVFSLLSISLITVLPVILKIRETDFRSVLPKLLRIEHR